MAKSSKLKTTIPGVAKLVGELTSTRPRTDRVVNVKVKSVRTERVMSDADTDWQSYDYPEARGERLHEVTLTLWVYKKQTHKRKAIGV